MYPDRDAQHKDEHHRDRFEGQAGTCGKPHVHDRHRQRDNEVDHEQHCQDPAIVGRDGTAADAVEEVGTEDAEAKDGGDAGHRIAELEGPAGGVTDQ